MLKFEYSTLISRPIFINEQDEEDRAARASMGAHVPSSSGQHVGTPSSSRSPRVANNDEDSFGTEYEAGCRSSSTFRLMQVKGLPQWANKGCVNIRGVIQVRNLYILGLCWRTTTPHIVNLSCAYFIY